MAKVGYVHDECQVDDDDLINCQCCQGNCSVHDEYVDDVTIGKGNWNGEGMVLVMMMMTRMMMMTLMSRQHNLTRGGGVQGCKGIVSSQVSNKSDRKITFSNELNHQLITN